jgi:pyrroline-5-carboxylate reductase
MPLEVGGPLLLVGAGKMGRSLLEAWLDEGLDPASVFVRDPRPAPDAEKFLASRGVALNDPAMPTPAVIVVAVKPQMLGDALAALVPVTSARTLLVSVVAGKTIAAFRDGLPDVVSIVRTMPNTPAAVRRGITVAIASQGTSEAQSEIAQRLLEAAGQVEWVSDERLIDAATAVSGSGPAYVFLLAETMMSAGIAAGLPPGLARRLARRTVEGAGELLFRSDLEPEVLRANVTSPNGTTEAALQVLLADDRMARLMQRAVSAAAARAAELAG